ncbi:hypothetical protein ACI79C_03050 [Geodermatophilus sp. SYSU D00697]
MSAPDITFVASDDRVTRRERRRRSDHRQHVLRLRAGTDRRGRPLGNHLRPDHWRSSFLSQEAAEYARTRADEVVHREGGQLRQARIFTDMLSCRAGVRTSGSVTSAADAPGLSAGSPSHPSVTRPGAAVPRPGAQSPPAAAPRSADTAG